jgi:hypothetical protein
MCQHVTWTNLQPDDSRVNKHPHPMLMCTSMVRCDPGSCGSSAAPLEAAAAGWERRRRWHPTACKQRSSITHTTTCKRTDTHKHADPHIITHKQHQTRAHTNTHTHWRNASKHTCVPTDKRVYGEVQRSSVVCRHCRSYDHGCMHADQHPPACTHKRLMPHPLLHT